MQDISNIYRIYKIIILYVWYILDISWVDLGYILVCVFGVFSIYVCIGFGRFVVHFLASVAFLGNAFWKSPSSIHTLRHDPSASAIISTLPRHKCGLDCDLQPSCQQAFLYQSHLALDHDEPVTLLQPRMPLFEQCHHLRQSPNISPFGQAAGTAEALDFPDGLVPHLLPTCVQSPWEQV